MIQSTLKPFLKKRIRTKWTQAELSNLLKTMEEIQPLKLKDWQKITKRMHELGSKRDTKFYKQKFNNYLDNKEKQLLNRAPQINKNILKYFNEGKSPAQISHLTQLNLFLVKKILKSILIKIQKNIPKIIGKSMDKKIRYNDYHFFTYIHKQNLELISLNKIKNMCLHWNALMNSKNDQNINDSGLQKKTLDYIKRNLIQFNTNLNLYSTAFLEYLSVNKDLQKDLNKDDLEQIQIDYNQLFLPSSYLLNQKQKPEDDSQMSIQIIYQKNQLYADKSQKFKAETCTSLNKQMLLNKKDCYRLSYFKLKRQAIQSFLPTLNNFQQQDIEINPPLPLQKYSPYFQSMSLGDDDDFFFRSNQNFENQLE